MSHRAIGLCLAMFAHGTISESAAASPCDDALQDLRPGERSPIRIAALDAADFGAAAEACGRTSLALESRASLLDASDEFYGQIYLNTSLRGTLALSKRVWLSLLVPGLEYRFVANATIDTSVLSLGGGAGGIHVSLVEWERSALAVYGRILIPSETIFQQATRLGVEPGLSFLHAMHPMFTLHANLALSSLFTFQAGQARPFFSPSLSGDLAFRPVRALSVAAGINAPFSDAFDARMQLGLYPAGQLAIALSLALPLVGRDRTDAVAGVSIGWDCF